MISPSSTARPRAFWADARFLIGIALVVAAIAGVWSVIATSRQTVPVLSAARTIVAGDTLDTDDLRIVEVALGGLGETYAVPGRLAPGSVATRTIGSGELVPVSAVSDAAAAARTTVVVSIAHPVPASLAPGDGVEVWHAPQQDDDGFGEPRILIAEAATREVRQGDGVLAQASADIELVVERDEVAAVLAAVADGDAISIVPVGAP